MNDEKFELTVGIYDELIPYKDYFDIALHHIHRKYTIGKNIFKVNFCPNENSKRVTQRIKISHNPNYYKELYQEIENISDNKTKRAMVNNILSSLVGLPQYAPKNLKQCS